MNITVSLFSIAYRRLHQSFHLQSLAIRIFVLVLVSVFSFSCSNQKQGNSPDFTVDSRPVVVGRTNDGETVIEKGLKINERVVTDGQLRLFPGAKIEIGTSPSTGAPKDHSR